MIAIFLLFLQISTAKIERREREWADADNEFMKQTLDMSSRNTEFTPSAELYRVIIDNVVENHDSPYNQLMRKTNDIDIDHFDAVRNHGEIIHEDLNMELRDKVIKIFETKCDELYADSSLNNDLLGQVVRESAILKENMGTVAYRDFLESLAEELTTYANGLEIKPRFPKYTNEDLRLKYEAANRITLKERVVTSNAYDITAFHDALQDRTWWDCRVLVTDRTREFLLKISEEIRVIED